jgi:Tfp pilus assembly protein PilX
MKIYNNEKGSALLITLCLLMMLTLIGVMAMKNTDTDIDLAFNEDHSEKAFYIAEAGARRAYVDINEDDTWRAGYDTVAFSNGIYNVNLIDSNLNAALFDTVLIISQGEYEQSQADVELTTVPEYFHPFAYGMFGKSGIAFDKYTCTDSYNSDSGTYAATQIDSLGSIGSNGTITSSQHVNFGGDISTATPGGITLGANNTVNGDTTSTRDSIDLDIIPPSEFTWAALNNNAPGGLSGTNFTYNGGTKALSTGAGGTVTLQSGIYFFSSITLEQNSIFSLAPGASVTIYVTGDIILRQSSTMNDGGKPSDMIIYSSGSTLQFDQDNIFYGAFYGPDAHIQYDQTTQAYGSLVGNTLQLDQNACFHYDRDLNKIKKTTTGKMFLVAWREI